MALRRFGVCGVLLLFAGVLSLLRAQESDTYAEEYDLFQKAQQETDSAKQKAICLEFVQKYKKSRLDPNVSYLYAQHFQSFRSKGQWQRLANEASKFLQYRPSDKNAAAAATEAYKQLGQPKKLVQFGTRLYSQSPSAGTAYLVASAYRELNDNANFLKWAQRTIKHDPNNAQMLVEVVNAYWTARDLAKASTYAQKAIKSMEGSGKEANQARGFCYRAVGENAYLNGQGTAAQRAFEKATQFDSKVGFAHMRLGYCYWRSNRVDKAIQSFARAVALGGSSAKEARQQLYTLLRQRYGNTSNAVSMIEAAKKELGVTG